MSVVWPGKDRHAHHQPTTRRQESRGPIVRLYGFDLNQAKTVSKTLAQDAAAKF
jgi:hypothetical protein